MAPSSSSAPISQRLDKIDHAAIKTAGRRVAARAIPPQSSGSAYSSTRISRNFTQSSDIKEHTSRRYPKGLVINNDVSEAAKKFRLLQACKQILKRWQRRLRDLDEVKRLNSRDQSNTIRYPELLRQARVRCSRQASSSEAEFIMKRSQHIINSKILLDILGEENASDLKEDDIPTVAIGGSGGGYRATFGFIASLQALQNRDCLDLTHWLAGVSGSCWSIAALYTVGRFNAGQVLRHYKQVAREGLHPMSRRAFDVVARSSKGVRFLLGPLLNKLRSGVVGIGVMDMYATLTSTYQLLSRSPIASTRLSPSTFELSKSWHRLGISEGKMPMPIFTAVRVRPRREAITLEIAEDKEEQQRPAIRSTDTLDQSVYKKREIEAIDARAKAFPPSQNLIKYSWWEMNPLEIGSSDEGIWIPSWSYGRTFVSGQSITTNPEISMSLLLGQVTSAPAGPLTGYISTLLATVPRGTIMSYLLSRLNKFVLHKRWENRWGNPIRGADEPSPLYGKGKRSNQCSNEGEGTSWENKKRIKLMDSGLSNNLPNHVFTSPARQADIIISFDFSSDVQTGAALSRLDEFAKQRQLIMFPKKQASALNLSSENRVAESASENPKAHEIERRFHGKYAQVLQAWYKEQLREEARHQMECGLHTDATLKPSEPPHMHLIYCPLLPHPSYPNFDPATSSFSTNYNLIWSPEEIGMLHKTAFHNTIDYIIPSFQDVYRSVYDTKKLIQQRRKDPSKN